MKNGISRFLSSLLDTGASSADKTAEPLHDEWIWMLPKKLKARGLETSTPKDPTNLSMDLPADYPTAFRTCVGPIDIHFMSNETKKIFVYSQYLLVSGIESDSEECILKNYQIAMECAIQTAVPAMSVSDCSKGAALLCDDYRAALAGTEPYSKTIGGSELDFWIRIDPAQKVMMFHINPEDTYPNFGE